MFYKTLAIARVFFHYIYMITIKLDQELDEEMYDDFSSLVIGGVDFGKMITRTHPSITRDNNREYITSFYEANQAILETNIRELQGAIDATSTEFFSSVQGIFGDDFSRNEYTGCLSIFDCNPRFVDKNLFQVFYQRDSLGKIEVTYHEVLHFAFFEYCEKHCPGVVAGMSVNGGVYWELSELVNVIILNQPAFQSILKRPEMLFYPSLEKTLPKISTLWDEHSKDLPRFVEKGLRMLSMGNEDT